MLGEMLTGIGFLIALVVVSWVVYKSFNPYARWVEYLEAYRIGRLLKHAEKNKVKLLFENKKGLMQEIDDNFEEKVK